MTVPQLGWVVDVQRDFMDPDGRLYVHDLNDPRDPGASAARAAIVRTVGWMRAHCAQVVFTGDWHGYSDREIDIEHPDPARETYPPHCMGLSPDATERLGAALIPEIAPDGGSLLVLARDGDDATARQLAHEAVATRRPVFIQKQEFSVFAGNHATAAFLEGLEAALMMRPRVLICGVATDVCVRHAVDGFLARGYEVEVVRDATWGLGLLTSAETFGRWETAGARIRNVDDLTAKSSD